VGLTRTSAKGGVPAGATAVVTSGAALGDALDAAGAASGNDSVDAVTGRSLVFISIGCAAD
jgi:hypothetical protein